MNILSYLPYVLLFMVATMILYGWGLLRAKNQNRDLTTMLSAKGIAKIRKALRKHGPMTRKELEQVVKGLTARQPFSKHGISVTNPRQFLDSLLPYMCKQKLITEEQQGKKTVYIYQKSS